MAEANDKPGPHWVKDALLADYSRIARQNATGASAADVERLVLSDLATYEAVQRDTRPTAPRPKRAPNAAPSAAVTALAQDMGCDVFKRPLAPKRKQSFVAFLDKQPASPKQAAAIMRLGQILQPASRFRPSVEFDYVLPRLAQAFAEMMQRLDLGRGEFEDKSANDCERIVWRAVEDLCDKSTGRLGPWWVR